MAMSAAMAQEKSLLLWHAAASADYFLDFVCCHTCRPALALHGSNAFELPAARQDLWLGCCRARTVASVLDLIGVRGSKHRQIQTAALTALTGNAAILPAQRCCRNLLKALKKGSA